MRYVNKAPGLMWEYSYKAGININSLPEYQRSAFQFLSYYCSPNVSDMVRG